MLVYLITHTSNVKPTATAAAIAMQLVLLLMGGGFGGGGLFPFWRHLLTYLFYPIQVTPAALTSLDQALITSNQYHHEYPISCSGYPIDRDANNSFVIKRRFLEVRRTQQFNDYRSIIIFPLQEEYLPNDLTSGYLSNGSCVLVVKGNIVFMKYFVNGIGVRFKRPRNNSISSIL